MCVGGGTVCALGGRHSTGAQGRGAGAQCVGFGVLGAWQHVGILAVVVVVVVVVGQ